MARASSGSTLSSESSERIQGWVQDSRASCLVLTCPSHGERMMRAPAASSMGMVSSVEPESTATISEARPRTESRVRPMVGALFLQTMATERGNAMHPSKAGSR